MKKVALVTGGTRGIGQVIAKDLCQDHKVAVTWRTTAPDCLPDGILPIQADLTEPGVPEKVIAEIVREFGGLDIIVNNAALVRSSPKDNFEKSAFAEILDTNLLVPIALLSAALPHLKSGSAIVNISSVNSQFPPLGGSIYGASKAGLNLWTRAMAKELGAGNIRVNAIAPGVINTVEKPRSAEIIESVVKDTALGRVGEPRDIARVVRFLTGEDSSFITGEIISVSGGYRI